MDHLSACYFCGIALDEPLADYPIVPAELRTDGERHTVTLCPSCHQKLDTVMDVVTDAVEGSPDLELGDVPDEEATTSAASADAEQQGEKSVDEESPADESAPDEDDDPLVAAMEPDVPEEFDTAGSEQNTTDETAPDLDQSVDFDTHPTDEDTGDESTSESAAESDSQDQTDEPDETSEEESDPAEVVSDAGASISALEYNKVMRLLQNREFPVERDEIETVAANAYGLARSDCAEVIDLAIDRDLLGEENGQLVRPE